MLDHGIAQDKVKETRLEGQGFSHIGDAKLVSDFRVLCLAQVDVLLHCVNPVCVISPGVQQVNIPGPGPAPCVQTTFV